MAARIMIDAPERRFSALRSVEEHLLHPQSRGGVMRTRTRLFCRTSRTKNNGAWPSMKNHALKGGTG
jgi:hypothetical protein